MLKKLLGGVFVFCVLSLQLISQGRCEDNLTFYNSFENGLKEEQSLETSSLISTDNAFALEEGIAGKALIVGIENAKKGLSYEYSAEGNIDLKEGTVAFWVKPLDWNGNDKYFHHFFEARGADSELIIYKYIESDKLFFLFGPRSAQWTIAYSSVAEWKPGEWHFVACSWKDRTMKLYVDGELTDTKDIGTLATTPFASFFIGGAKPEQWGTNPQGKTLMDEVKIYGVALDAPKITEMWKTLRPSSSAKSLPLLSVGKANNMPVLDGKIGDDEYNFKAGGFLDIRTGNYSSDQAVCFLSYDASNLYLGIQSKVSGSLVANVRDKDNVNVWKDDAVEIFLMPSKNDFFQFIVNSADAVYDAKNSNPNWNMGGRCINNIKSNIWTMEMAVPFASIGAAPPVAGEIWRFNICRSYASLGRYTAISPVRNNYLDSDNFSRLKFIESPLCINIGSPGDLNRGDLDMELAVANMTAGSENVHVSVDLENDKGNVLNCSKDLFLKSNDEIRLPLQKKGFQGQGKLSIAISTDRQGVLFNRLLPFSTEAPFKYNYLYTIPEKGRVMLGVYQRDLTLSGKYYPIRVRMFDTGGTPVLEEFFKSDKHDDEISVDTAKLALGSYKIEIAFLEPESKNVLSSFQENWTKFAFPPPWQKNGIGTEQGVPAPWTQIKLIDGNNVRCWGREYRFKDSILPSQIISQGKKMFASPCRLDAIVGGQVASLSDARTSVIKNTESKVILRGKGNLGNIEVSSEILLEYDGFVWINLRFTPREPTNLANLIFTIPLRREYAGLINCGDYSLRGTGLLPDNGWKKNLKEKPVFWIGNEEVGLQWFAENLKGWHLDDYGNSLEITPGDITVAAKLNIVDIPLLLKEPLEISFGLQATPVKPRPQGWRNWKIGDEYIKGSNVVLWFSDWSTWYNYPVFKNTKEIERLRGVEAKGLQVTPYLALAAVSPFSPEFKYEGEKWRKLPQARTPNYCPDDGEPLGWTLALPCANSSEYRDFYLWKLTQAFKDHKFQGLYFDYGVPLFCQSQEHGCGWVDNNGSINASYNILGTRELVKRIYIMAKGYRKDALIAYHCSGEIVMPVHSFADILVDGENFTEAVGKQGNYFDILTLDKFRAEYTSLVWGPIPVCLCELIRGATIFSPDRQPVWSGKDAAKPNKHLLGLIMVNDGKIWLPGGEPWLSVWEAGDDFGLWDDKIEFFGYWNNSQYVRVMSPQSKNRVVSIYRRTDSGRVMLVLFNDTDEDVKLDIWIDRKGLLGNNVDSFTDAITKEQFHLSSDRLLVPVSARDVRFLTTIK